MLKTLSTNLVEPIKCVVGFDSSRKAQIDRAEPVGRNEIDDNVVGDNVIIRDQLREP